MTSIETASPMRTIGVLVFRADPTQPGLTADRLTLTVLVRVQPAVVDLGGQERAQRRVHAPRSVEEHATIVRNRRVVGEHMLERAHTSPAGMRGEADLCQL